MQLIDTFISVLYQRKGGQHASFPIYTKSVMHVSESVLCLKENDSGHCSLSDLF